MIYRPSVTALIILLFAAPVFAQFLAYTDVRPLAEKHEQESPPEYLEKLVAFYQDFASTTLPACVEEVGAVDESLITVVSRVDQQGKVLHTWSLGNSRLAPCFLAAFEQATLPPPPFQPYYTVLDMRGDPTRY